MLSVVLAVALLVSPGFASSNVSSSQPAAGVAAVVAVGRLLWAGCGREALWGHQEVTPPGLIRLRPILPDGAQARPRCTQYG